MTEAEWRTCADPEPMLWYFREAGSRRKLTLFSCGCCRLHWSEIDSRTRACVTTAEDHVGSNQCVVVDIKFRGQKYTTAAFHTVPHSSADATSQAEEVSARTMLNLYRDKAAAARMARAVLIRDIFGLSPFRPVAINPDWLTSTVVALARQMYDSRDFSLMPILADALQDAGCEDEDILSHCRSDGPHVRGCWVVDLMLGKT